MQTLDKTELPAGAAMGGEPQLTVRSAVAGDEFSGHEFIGAGEASNTPRFGIDTVHASLVADIDLKARSFACIAASATNSTRFASALNRFHSKRG